MQSLQFLNMLSLLDGSAVSVLMTILITILMAQVVNLQRAV